MMLRGPMMAGSSANYDCMRTVERMTVQEWVALNELTEFKIPQRRLWLATQASLLNWFACAKRPVSLSVGRLVPPRGQLMLRASKVSVALLSGASAKRKLSPASVDNPGGKRWAKRFPPRGEVGC